MAKPACVLVCVSNLMNCDTLIAAGKNLSRTRGIPLRVLSVQPKKAFRSKTGEELEHLFGAALAAGADMTAYYDDRGPVAVIEYILQNAVSGVVLGAPGSGSSALALRLRAECPGLEIHQIFEDAPEYAPLPHAAAAMAT